MREIVEARTVPVRLDVTREKRLAKKFGVFWTPTLLYMDPAAERILHRWIGYLPPEEFAPQVLVGVGLASHQVGRLDRAQDCFREATRRFPASFLAPEGIYWDGVAEYKKTGASDALQAACRRILDEYPGTIRAKKVEYIRKGQDAGAGGQRQRSAGG